MQLFDENENPISLSEEGKPGFSWTHKVFFSAYTAMKNRGGNIDSPSMSPTWLRSIDCLTDIGWHKVFIPIGPWRYGESPSAPVWRDGKRVLTLRLATASRRAWPTAIANQKDKALAEMLRADWLSYISGMAPLLLRSVSGNSDKMMVGLDSCHGICLFAARDIFQRAWIT